MRQTDFSNDEAVGLPRRPAQPARRRDPAARAGCRGGRRGHHRGPRQRGGVRLPAGSRRRGRDPGSARRGPPVRGVAAGRAATPRHRARRWASGPRGRPGPTSPAGSTDPDRPDVLRDRRGRRPRLGPRATPAHDPTDGDRRPSGRGQGRLLLPDHRRRRASIPDRIRHLVDTLAETRGRGAEVVLVSSGAIAAGLAPLGLARRPRALPGAAGRGLGGPGAAGAPLHRGAGPARHHRRPGAAHRRRRDPALALPQRLPDLREAARARRPPDRQRERHRGHHRDPVRRQRPAGRPGRPPGARRPAGAAQRRRRAVRRQPVASRRGPGAGGGRGDRPAPESGSDGPAPSGSAPAACGPRSTRRGSPPAPGSRWCSPPPSRAGRALAGDRSGHALPRDRPAAADPAALAGPRHRAEGHAGPRRGCGPGGRGAPGVAARRRRHRGHRVLRRR